MTETRGAPFIRSGNTAGTLRLDVLIALLAPTVCATVTFGWRVPVLLLVSIGTALLSEALGCLLQRRRLTLLDGSAAVTGWLIGMMVSPIAPFWLVIVASAFAILIVKMPFGGDGHNVFNPAAAGIALVTQCFSAELFLYPDPDAVPPVFVNEGSVLTAASPASLLRTGGAGPYDGYDFLFGQFPGPLGATAVFVLCACAVFLFVRKTTSPTLTLSFLATCSVIAVLFPRVTDGTWYQSMILELCSGYLLFAGVFLLTDPVTSPHHPTARAIYGVLAGVLVMLLRHIGRFEESTCFAILLCNAVSAAIDRITWRIGHAIRKRREAA